MIRALPTMFRPLLAGCLLLALVPVGVDAATLEITGPDGASVVVNERIMGFLPLSRPLNLAPGEYAIRSDLPGHHPFETTVNLYEVDDWQRLHIRHLPMSKRVAWTSNLLFAGMGQHYMGKSLKGYFFNAVEAGGLLTALAGELQRSTSRKDYLIFLDRYDSALNQDDLNYYRGQSEKAYQDMEDMESLRNTGLMVAGGAVVLSVLDALINFPSLETGAGTMPHSAWDHPDTDTLETVDPFAVHAAFKLGF